MSDTPPPPQPTPAPDNDGDTWVSISEAARRLGVSRQAVQRRIGRGTLETRTEGQGNRTRLLVRVLPPLQDPVPKPRRQRAPAPVADDGPLSNKDVQIARLEERLAAAEEVKAAFKARIEELRAELARERQAREEAERWRAEDDQRYDELRRQFGELADARRRPWPGLKAWWRRVWEGEG